MHRQYRAVEASRYVSIPHQLSRCIAKRTFPRLRGPPGKNGLDIPLPRCRGRQARALWRAPRTGRSLARPLAWVCALSNIHAPRRDRVAATHPAWRRWGAQTGRPMAAARNGWIRAAARPVPKPRSTSSGSNVRKAATSRRPWLRIAR